MISILSKNYNASEIEAKWQAKWKDEELFRFDPDLSKPVYSIDTPPPFTSGTLHMGHIYNHVWIDIVARYKRMRGFNVYLPQGFDCHGLPTELRVEKEPGVDIKDRDGFLKKCREWTETAISRMRKQFESIGYSADWNHSYRTIDDPYKALVQKTLLEFYKKNLLYREKHPVLWCPKCETALAKAEVGYVEKEGKLYHIDLDAEGHKLTIATTRPEMMPACVAVLVHPEDPRYKKFVGKKAGLPIFKREVPVIADLTVEKEFGTGVVYVCTFGDEQDMAWQKQYKLPVIEAIDKKGNLTSVAGKYSGLGVEDGRHRITEDLIEDGHIRKVEKIRHNVLCHTERSSCNTPIELLPLEQWFIKVRDFTKDIVHAAGQMKWYPDYMLQRLIDWSESMDWDWCISRQRIFGTPIPFWVCKCGEIIPTEENLPVDPRGTERKCMKCGGDAIGEQNVCDCWVDSSITPLAISRWGSDDKFFKKTYPLSLRPQGYEIIRTWTFYTIFRNLILTNQPCFRELMINGMVAGPDGRKMSKSLGNIIEPEEPLKKYSADTLRQWSAAGTLGNDYPFSWEECEHSQKFLTKLWNITRFIEMHLKDFDGREINPEKLNEMWQSPIEPTRNSEGIWAQSEPKALIREARWAQKLQSNFSGDKVALTYVGEAEPLRHIDRWILSKLERIVDNSTRNLDNYVFNMPLEEIRSFVWHDLADDYLEMVKHRLYKPDIYGADSRVAAQYKLNKILTEVLRLLSPFTPHICDEIWSNLFGGYATTSNWPETNTDLISPAAEEIGELAREIISLIRKYKSEKGMSLGSEMGSLKILANPGLINKIEKIRMDIIGTGKIRNLEISKSDVEKFDLEFTQ